MSSEFKVLVKFPTRGRPDRFFPVLNRYYYGAKRKDLTKFLVSCDNNDPLMNNDAVRAKFAEYNNLQVCYGNSKSKIEAVNADMDQAGDYDILLLASDDMIPEAKGYDEDIRQEMASHFPDTDGVLWFFDGYRKDFNTLCILGKKYYERFGYIYHPSYKSFWSDNEFTEVADRLQRQFFIDKVIIRHVHPDWIRSDEATAAKFRAIHPEATNSGIDETFIKNLPFERADAAVYQERKSKGFP